MKSGYPWRALSQCARARASFLASTAATIAAVIASTSLLTGCAPAAVKTTAPPSALFQDQRFAPPSETISGDRIFAVTPAMKQYLQEEVLPNQHFKDARRALFEALYRRDQLKLEYDAAMTRNAEQTFEARSGNCLSLVIMTAALARELNLTVQFQKVEVEQSWSRNGSVYFSSNHVNLALGFPRVDYRNGITVSTSNALTVDFIPIPASAHQRVEALEDETIIAMYMNNRAAELLAQEKLDDAYWWARKAIQQDPSFLYAYNTLGVIYQHHHDMDLAEQMQRYTLTRSPDNTIFLSNLIKTLEDQGRGAETAVLRTRLAKLEPYPPFYFFHQGQTAMEAGDYAQARKLFLRELERAPDYHEFHFWLAVAAYKMGDLKEADQHMRLAVENSTTRGDHDIYSAKLDSIKAYEAHAGSGK